MKLNQIPHFIFQATRQFLFKLCNTVQCHDTFLWNFLVETVYALDIKSQLMYNFQTFGCSNEGSPNFSCSFWNHKVRVYSNVTSLFSVMKDNSSVFFLAQTSYTLDKNNPLNWIFWTFEWMGENSPNLSCHIWNKTSVFLKLFINLQCHRR